MTLAANRSTPNAPDSRIALLEHDSAIARSCRIVARSALAFAKPGHPTLTGPHAANMIRIHRLGPGYGESCPAPAPILRMSCPRR